MILKGFQFVTKAIIIMMPIQCNYIKLGMSVSYECEVMFSALAVVFLFLKYIQHFTYQVFKCGCSLQQI